MILNLALALPQPFFDPSQKPSGVALVFWWPVVINDPPYRPCIPIENYYGASLLSLPRFRLNDFGKVISLDSKLVATRMRPKGVIATWTSQDCLLPGVSYLS
jgi:hypothetical protein